VGWSEIKHFLFYHLADVPLLDKGFKTNVIKKLKELMEDLEKVKKSV
jgi:hypothetical protein